LAAAFLARGRLGGCAFDRCQVERWRPGGVGGILLQARLRGGDLALQLLDPLIQLLEGGTKAQQVTLDDGPKLAMLALLSAHARILLEIAIALDSLSALSSIQNTAVSATG
jgi:hypothetical protein